MEIPYHENLKFANTRNFWDPFDSKERWESNMNNISSAKLLTRLGYDHPEAIIYEYNSHGFRDLEFDHRECGIAFGCSFTHGTGIQQNQTWPAVLSEILGVHVWNLGIGGTSLDTIFRISEYYVDLLKPKFVTLLVPPNTRFEHVENQRFHITTVHDYEESDNRHFFKQWFLNQENVDIQQKKNLFAIEKICKDFTIPFVKLCSISDWNHKNTQARDLSHPDSDSNAYLANQFADLLN